MAQDELATHLYSEMGEDALDGDDNAADVDEKMEASDEDEMISLEGSEKEDESDHTNDPRSAGTKVHSFCLSCARVAWLLCSLPRTVRVHFSPSSFQAAHDSSSSLPALSNIGAVSSPLTHRTHYLIHETWR